KQSLEHPPTLRPLPERDEGGGPPGADADIEAEVVGRSGQREVAASSESMHLRGCLTHGRLGDHATCPVEQPHHSAGHDHSACLSEDLHPVRDSHRSLEIPVGHRLVPLPFGVYPPPKTSPWSLCSFPSGAEPHGQEGN